MSIQLNLKSAGAMAQSIRIRGHELTADEVQSNGGVDTGPTPHDFYDAALGACKALTVIWYARKKVFRSMTFIP